MICIICHLNLILAALNWNHDFSQFDLEMVYRQRRIDTATQNSADKFVQTLRFCKAYAF
ncbi:hypothetical protein PF005_g25624 [Phytophthora fragariae]|uniref:Uncharacterized protein n=1 Tax=Phytophthora fragariae TaxID=53985 RepID=A0A6A3WU87_9STRA|nr:hypothetical protein PF003_g23584 [Phytophthora fragariae]KAE8922056.1 hypothetical protein PF009_g27669 [Phytophthora fragariae]KAE8971990.1 hypothetical protein PF011_g25818 [Phytophthora fragariae]KAE9077111.1 hypothetical protein PF010_g23638 [Phytophthora fragariae]KAE9097269.1 hypothetical protein PF006_g23608 [Phytophthora fragariae]